MKKIIALFVLVFAFSLNANAQDNSVAIERSAKKDLEALMGIIKVDDNMQMPFLNLFKKKHEGLAAPDATDASKREISSVIEAKLRASLNGEQTLILEKNTAVFAQLISGTPSTEIREKK